jgi:hypothetical protein
MNKFDGKGQSTKAPTQMLASILGSGAKRRAAQQQKKAGHEGFVPLPDAGGMGTNKAFVNKGDGQGLRGTSKLSGFGTDKAFLHKYDGKDQSTKAPTQMLADIRGSGAARRQARNMNYIPLPDAGGMGTNKAFVNKGDGKGLRGTSSLDGMGTNKVYKGQSQMLASILGSGAKRRASQKQQQLSGFGTDVAYMNKFDGKGQSTKAPTQMLASILGSGAKRRAAQQHKKAGHEGFVPLPDAGGMGTNKAFVNKGDGQGLRGTSKLSGFGTDKAFLHKYDGKDQSTKGKTQQLYEWTADMEGTYLPADDFYTGAGTKQIQLSEPGFAHALTDETNLGGIPGVEPANVLPYASTYVIGH